MDKVIISCNQCDQKLRIPITDNEIVVSCPCGNKIICIGGEVKTPYTKMIYKTTPNTYDPSTGFVYDHQKTKVGLWFDKKPDDVDDVYMRYYCITLKQKGYDIDENELIMLYMNIEFGYRVVPNHYDNMGGNFFMFSGNLAPGEKVKMVDNIIGEVGKRNPFTKKSKRLADIFLKYDCPTCKIPNAFKIEILDEIDGANCRCNNCENLSHIPSCYRQEYIPEDASITAGVIVPIKDFGEWYVKHPAYLTMLKSGNSAAYMHYGLFAFCRKCNYEFQYSVLSSFALSQSSKRFIFEAHSDRSKREMDALCEGKCLMCDSTNLIVIFSDFTLTPEQITIFETK